MQRDTTGNHPETIDDAWQAYYTEALRPLNLTPDSPQYIETRRAFYSGASRVFNMATHFSEVYATEESAVLLDAISAEFRQFRKDIESGLA